MKWIKRFNEELDTKTYRSAGHKLDYYNKSKKASKLFDFADEQDFGFYNMTWSNSNDAMIVKEAKFTEPRLSAIYYTSMPTAYSDKLNQYDGQKYGNDSESLAEELVQRWVRGESGLCLTFEFTFRASRETISNTNQNSNFVWSNRNPNPKHTPAFSLQIDLSDWYSGIEDWDSEARWQAEHNNEEFTPSTVNEFYEWSKSATLSIKNPNSNTFGLFSDRKSAIKFKNWLLTNCADRIKESIINVLRIVGGESKDIEQSVDSFRKIKIQGLYDDDLPTRGSGSQWVMNRWFEKDL